MRTTNDHVSFMLVVSTSLPTVNYYSTAGAHSSDHHHLLATNKIFYVLQISPTATCHSTLLETQKPSYRIPAATWRHFCTRVLKVCSWHSAKKEVHTDTWLLNYTRTPSTDSAESKLRSRLPPTISTKRVKLEIIIEATVPKIRSFGMWRRVVCHTDLYTDAPGWRSRYSDSLQVWRSGDRIPVGGRKFSVPVQTGPGAYPASYTMGTGYFLGVKRPGRGVDHPPQSSAKVKERVQLYLYSPYGPSWPVLGWTLPLT
jgi:hypothetical protein